MRKGLKYLEQIMGERILPSSISSQKKSIRRPPKMRSPLLYLLLVTPCPSPQAFPLCSDPACCAGKKPSFSFLFLPPLLLFRSECAICSSPTSKTPSPEKHIIFVLLLLLLLPRKGGDAPPSQSAEEEEEKIFSVDRPVVELGGGGVMGERLLSSWLGGLASVVFSLLPSIASCSLVAFASSSFPPRVYSR